MTERLLQRPLQLTHAYLSRDTQIKSLIPLQSYQQRTTRCSCVLDTAQNEIRRRSQERGVFSLESIINSRPEWC